MADAITPKVAIPIRASLKVDDLSVLARSTEAVPDAAHRMDQRIGLLIVDLAAQASDIDVNDIGRRIEMKIPDVLQQHGTRNDTAFVAHQVLQELEFLRQKQNFLAAPAGGARDQIDGEIADTQDGFLGDGVAPSAQRLESRQQFEERKRLDQVIVAARTQAAHAIIDFAERADDQEGRGDAVIAQLPHDGDAVDIRQHTIDRDHRIIANRTETQRLAARRGEVHLIAAGRELFHQLTSGFRVVLDDQDTAMASRHGLAPRIATSLSVS